MGAVLFDPGYLANPLVYCGTAGIMPGDKSFKQVLSRRLNRGCWRQTGRTGSTGPPFSSGELLPRNQAGFRRGGCRSATPITEKKMMDALYGQGQ